MLGRWTRSLGHAVAAKRREWAATNAARLKYEPGVLRRAFDRVSESPNWHVAVVVVCFLSLSLAAWCFPPPYPGLIDFKPTDPEKYSGREAFFALWATQAAIIAVVYPMVLAFVTILIQRQSGSKASLEAYFVTSSAKLTGVSSLGLVLGMAVQFFFLDQAASWVVFAWMVLDGLWFVVNTALTVFFLDATFEFASPERRVRARNRYLLTRAWPAEWKFHLSRHLAANPIERGLLRAKMAMGGLADASPAFSPRARMFGTQPALTLRYRGAKAVVDIRYVFLELALWLWTRRIASVRSAGEVASEGTLRAVFSRVGPVLEQSVDLREQVYHMEPFFTVSKSAHPNLLERVLLRLSISLSRDTGAPRVSVLDGLAEAREEVLESAAQNAESEFERRLTVLLGLYDQLIESSAVVIDGEPDNWALLQDSVEYPNAPLAHAWQGTFLELHKRALDLLPESSHFAEHTVRVPARFYARQQEYGHRELWRLHLRLQYFHLRATLDWATERLASIPTPNPVVGALLQEPLRRRYEAVLKSGVSAWEGIKNMRLLPEKLMWADVARLAPLFEAHLRYTILLTARALQDNDARGAFWMADMLFRWRSQNARYHHAEGVSYFDRFKVRYEDILLPEPGFRELFPLPEYEEATDETVWSVWDIAFGNVWRDYLCTLVASVLTHTDREGQQRFAYRFARTALTGEATAFAWSGAGHPFNTGDKLLYTYLRMYAIAGDELESSYGKRLEEVADSLAPSALADGIAGRIYSSSGTAFGSLLSAHVFMLACMAGDGWKASPDFDRQFSEWRAADEVRRRIADFLRSAIEELGRPEFIARWSAAWAAIAEKTDDALRTRVSETKLALQDLLNRLEHLRALDVAAAPLSDAALARLRSHASSALGRLKEVSPLNLFDEAQRTDYAGQPSAKQFTHNVQGWDRGSLTDPPQAPPLGNEQEFVADATAQAVAFFGIRTALATATADTRAVASRAEFEDSIRQYGRSATAAGRRPVLLVSSRADPPWLVEMARRPAEGGLPSLRRMKENSGEPGYVGHIGETAIYVAPIAAGQPVLCDREVLRRVLVLGPADNPFVLNVKDEATPGRCTLQFSWWQLTEVGEGSVLKLKLPAPPAREGAAAARPTS